MTEQEMFNIIWSRAKDQRKAITESRDCMYREPSTGLSCFLGACIPDELYRPSWDRGLNTEAAGVALDAVLVAIGYTGGRGFPAEIQAIHDHYPAEDWDASLRPSGWRAADEEHFGKP
jgi:hypothetical protein